MKKMEKLYYEHRLSNIDNIIKRINKKYDDLNDKDRMYVYIKSFPDDKILTGKYYQSCGRIYEDQRDEWLASIDRKDWILEGNGEVWEVCIMTFKALKELLLKEKETQMILREKYPGIILD